MVISYYNAVITVWLDDILLQTLYTFNTYTLHNEPN